MAALALVFSLLAPGAGAAPPEAKVFDLPYVLRDLPNGLRVVVVRTDYPDLVTLQIPVQTGSRNEVEPGKSGFAHFFEHMMFRGTPRHPDYAAVTQSVGADRNAFTSDDLTNYYVNFTKADLEKILDLESDRFMNLAYTEPQFRTEALAVKGEYLKNYSNPFQKINEATRELAFTTHTYRHTTMGFLKDIEDMPNQLAYSKVFFDRWYRPERTMVIVVGDVDPERTAGLVEKYFGTWPRGSYAVEVPAEPPPAGPRQQHVKWEAPTQALVTLAFRGPAFRAAEKEMPAVDLVGEVWFSPTSDLYQKLVVKERLVDQLFYSSPDRKDPYLITIGARLIKPESAKVVTDAIVDTVVRARTERVGAQRLADIKSNLKYQFAAGLDSSQAIGAMLANFGHFERDPETVNRTYRTYDSLTPDDLLAAANRYLVDRGRAMVTLSNGGALPGSEVGSVDAKVDAAKAGAAADIATLEMKGESPLIAVSLLFSTGAASDPAGQKGLAQLTAGLVADGGSEARTIRELTEARFPLAAGFGAQVDKEMVRFGGLVHRDNLERWSALALEQLLTPGWREEDLKRVRTQLVNQIRTNLRGNNDEELAKEVLYESIYGPQHPYGTLSLGDVSDLEKLTLEDVKAFYAQQLTQANLTLGVAGGYDPAWLAGFKRSLGRLRPGTKSTLALPRPPGFTGREAVVVEKETPSVAVSFGHPIDLRRGDKDWVALWLVRSWLGEHRQGGRLYDRIREIRGMNYGDYAYVEYFPRGMFQFFPDANLGRRQQAFQVWIRPLRDNNDAVFAIRNALYELDKLVKEGLSAKAFEEQRTFLTKFVSQMTKTQSAQLGGALDGRYYGTGPFPDYVRGELAKLTLAEVNRVLRKHLQTKDLKFAFVTRDAADLVRRLTSDAPSPIKYPTPKPELRAEDAVIESLPLRLEAARVRTVPAAQVFE